MMKNDARTITLKDVADYCNVSIMTASRAFRQDSVIHPETRSRILRAAEKLNYHCNSRRGRPQSAKCRQLKQIQLILGTCHGNTPYFQMRLLTAIEQQLASFGYECIIRTTTGDYDIFIRLLNNAKNHRCVATLLMGDYPREQLNSLLSSLPGAILLDNSAEDIFDGIYSSFSFDNQLAAFIGTTHLIKDCGRRRILLINGSRNHFFSNELLAGYRRSVEENQITFDEELIIHTDFSAESAANALKGFINSGRKFDAVLTNDEMATGVYRTLHENKIRIPEDVSVCGCDDLPVGKQLYPELTSISLDYEALAGAAIQHLNDHARHLTDPVHAKLPPILRPGRSTLGS